MDQERSVVYTQKYGEAGAVSFLGRRFGLRRVISGHNNYYLWGPGPMDSTTVVIVVGGNMEDLRGSFENVQEVARTQSRYAMPYENNRPIYLCRNLKRPIKEIWPSTKSYQ